MKQYKKKKEIKYDDTNVPGGYCMIPGGLSEKDRMAMMAIIEKNKAEKERKQPLLAKT